MHLNRAAVHAVMTCVTLLAHICVQLVQCLQEKKSLLAGLTLHGECIVSPVLPRWRTLDALPWFRTNLLY